MPKTKSIDFQQKNQNHSTKYPILGRYFWKWEIKECLHTLFSAQQHTGVQECDATKFNAQAKAGQHISQFKLMAHSEPGKFFMFYT